MLAPEAMQDGLFVHRSAGHTLLGVRQNNTWIALRAAADDDEGAAGNVYRGRVVRLVPGMQAAFVDIGQRRPAFLHFDDAPPAAPGAQTTTTGKKGGRATDLQLHQRLLVQVRKEPLGDKGARVTGQLALSGRFVVYLPHARHVAVSQRITDAARRAALETLLRSALARLAEGDAAAPQNLGGAIARTASGAAAHDDALVAELGALHARYLGLQARFAEAVKPALLSVEHTAALQRCLTLCGQLPAPPPALSGNDAAFLQQLADALGEQGPTPTVHAGPNVHFARKSSDRHGLFAALSQALRRRVALPSGGSLALDECEAMAVVDINSGKFVGKAALDDTLRALNLEAAQEVARQLHLRGVGGIVAVDFVDMKDRGHRGEVHGRLQQAMAALPCKSYVAPMNELGVVTLTGRRTGPSLRQASTQTCAHCQGRGRVRAAWQVASAVLEATAFALREEPAATMLVNVAPSVAEVLHGAAQGELTALEARSGCAVMPVARAHWGVERFELWSGARPGSVQAHDLAT